MQIIEQFYHILEEVSIADLFPIISLSMLFLLENDLIEENELVS